MLHIACGEHHNYAQLHTVAHKKLRTAVECAAKALEINKKKVLVAFVVV